MRARRLRLLVLAIAAALAVAAAARDRHPGHAGAPAARETDPMRPKVFDFPGHNNG